MLDNISIILNKFLKKNNFFNVEISEPNVRFLLGLSGKFKMVQKKYEKNYKVREIIIDKSNDVNKFNNVNIDDYNNSILNMSNYISNTDNHHDINRKYMEQYLNTNGFIPYNLFKLYNNNNINLKKYEHENITIELYNPENVKSKINIDNIFLVCMFFKSIIDNRKIKLIIMNTDFEKFFPKNGKIINKNNVNGGACIRNEIIYIYRNSEYLKVLIHELVHYFELDLLSYSSKKYFDQIIQEKFKFKYDININESYTEATAIILHSCIIYVLFNEKYKINDIIEREINFSFFQVSKIMSYYGFFNMDDLLNNYNKINEKTSVFSYFILKLFLLEKVNDLIDSFRISGNYYVDSHDKKFLKISKIISSPKNYLDPIIYEFLKKSSIFKSNNDKITNSLIIKILRMSCFHLN